MSASVPSADLFTDDQLLELLRTIAERDSATEQLDSADLGRRLGWPAARTDASVAVAKARLLVWAIRGVGIQGSCFEDIELTVQGRRYLVAHDG